MGDPKKIRKKFSKPRHPWQKARIEEEKVLVIGFGLKNKREVYRLNAMISPYYATSAKRKRITSCTFKATWTYWTRQRSNCSSRRQNQRRIGTTFANYCS
jgi:hypothetical protein